MKSVLDKFSTVTAGIVTSYTIPSVIYYYLSGGTWPQFFRELVGLGWIDKLIVNTIIGLAILTLFCKFLALYISRRAQAYSDFFAAKVGYGEAFHSAILKVNNYLFASSLRNNLVNGLNIFDRILHFVNKVSTTIGNIAATLGLSGRMSTTARVNLAKRNYLTFNNQPNQQAVTNTDTDVNISIPNNATS